MIPPFVLGLLPPGIHRANMKEIEAAFGWNVRRRVLLTGLAQVLQNLAVAGCELAWLDGSFVTSKEIPGDFDLVWDLDGVDLDLVDPVILDVEAPRLRQRIKYGGDLLPNVVESSSGMPFLEFFQQDKHTGQQRGIVEIRTENPA